MKANLTSGNTDVVVKVILKTDAKRKMRSFSVIFFLFESPFRVLIISFRFCRIANNLHETTPTWRGLVTGINGRLVCVCNVSAKTKEPCTFSKFAQRFNYFTFGGKQNVAEAKSSNHVFGESFRRDFHSASNRVEISREKLNIFLLSSLLKMKKEESRDSVERAAHKEPFICIYSLITKKDSREESQERKINFCILGVGAYEKLKTWAGHFETSTR